MTFILCIYTIWMTPKSNLRGSLHSTLADDANLYWSLSLQIYTEALQLEIGVQVMACCHTRASLQPAW